MLEFKPPKNNRIWMAICKWGMPLETVVRSRIEIRVNGTGVQRFKKMNGKHTVVVCNHTDQIDPEVMFGFSKIVGEDFYFIAARECFDWIAGLTGLFFQHLGVYSVMRGEADYDSFAMTRKIISQETRKLVMFPEGEVTRQPDVVLPMRPGAMRLFMEAQEDLLARQPNEPVYVQPMAIRWTYKSDISKPLLAALVRIEKRLRIENQSGELSERVYAAAAAMITALETEYLLPNRDELPIEQRVIHFRGEVLRRVAAALDLEVPADESQMSLLRRIGKEVRFFITGSTEGMSPYQKHLHTQQVAKMRRYLHDVHLVQHFIGVREHPTSKPLTQERLAYIVGKLEQEILGFVSFKGIRIAVVEVGEPFSLLDFYPQYRLDKDAAIERASQYMREKIQELVDLTDSTKQTDCAVFLPK